MNRPKAIVVVTEGIGASLLGAYGSATSTTPALDRLAAGSVVLDQCLIDSFNLPDQMRSLWTAAHALQIDSSHWCLWPHLAAHGLTSHLLTDSVLVAELAEKSGCAHVTQIELTAADQPAAESEDCNLVQVFASAMQLLEHDQTPDLLWIHARALRWPWDAPLELRAAMIDPEDPLPPAEVHLPSLRIDEDSDPDLVVGWGQVAAAQMAVLDEAMHGLMETVARRSDAQLWSWLFCSTGGIPLGEHQQLGDASGQGYSEEIAVAAMIRPSGALPIGSRRAELCQLPDLIASLMAAMQLPITTDRVWGRNLLQLPPAPAVISWPERFSWAWSSSGHSNTGHSNTGHSNTGHSAWVRTPAWSMLRKGDTDQVELYAKPDDRWEVNDIADRSHEITELILQLWPQVQQATAAGAREQMPAVPEPLRNYFR